MSIVDDERAVSPVLSAILLAGIVVLLLSTLQTQAVPSWNNEIEFEHNERVQGDIQRLQGAILAAAADGNQQSVSVELGPSYPERFVLQNPNDPAVDLVVDNTTATGEVADYWNGSQRNFSTRALVYDPNYNYYSAAPETIYESGIVYNRFDSVSLQLTAQNLVDGNRITIVVLDGNLTESSAGSVSVDIDPVSSIDESITVSNSTEGPITLSIPTQLSNETWSDLLEDEYAGNGGNIVSQAYRTGSPYNRLVLTLEEDTNYELRMAKVGVGTGTTKKSGHYIVPVSGDGSKVDGGDTQELVAVVRDRFNNPVSNVTVDAKILSGEGSVTSADTTGSDGEAAFTYTAPDNPTTAKVEVTINGNRTDYHRAVFTVEVADTGPEATNLSAQPDPVPEGGDVEIEATVSDVDRGGTQIVAAEYYFDADPGEGQANAMTAVDGEFDQVTEAIQAVSVNTSGLSVGDHTLHVRGKDAAGNWGPTVNVTIEITQATSETLIEGVAYKSKGGGNLAIYDYDDNSTSDTGKSVGPGIGGIGDWNKDGNLSEIAFINGSNRLIIYDKSTGSTTELGTQNSDNLRVAGGVISFFGDFDADGERDDIMVRQTTGATQGLRVIVYNDSAAGNYELYTVKRLSSGEQISGNDNTDHIAGGRDVDADGKAEFAYVDGGGELVVAEVIRVESDSVYVRVEPTGITSVTRVGGVADVDDDDQIDDFLFANGNDNDFLYYYDYSRDKSFLFEDESVTGIGQGIDVDGDGVQRVFYAGEAPPNLKYKIVTDLSPSNTGEQVSDVGGAN